MPAWLTVFPRPSISPGVRRAWRRYRREARRPVQCLLFLGPLVLIYEIGAWSCGHGGLAARDLLAHSAIAGLLAWFGLAGVWVPPAVFIATLLIWHRLRRDLWHASAGALLWMAAESLVLAIPLLVLAAFFAPPPVQHAAATRLMIAIGAGVYEELVFRLLLIAGFKWLMTDVVRVGRDPARWLAVGLATLVFAVCHFQPVGQDTFAWGSFWFRFAGGLYLSVVFVGRGLGVSSGCHVAYGLLLAWLRGV